MDCVRTAIMWSIFFDWVLPSFMIVVMISMPVVLWSLQGSSDSTGPK